MKNRILALGILALLLFGLGTSCKKDTPEDPNVYITNWMYQNMEEVYFWNTTMPAQSTLSSIKDPDAFFNKLIYTPEDRWSWLTDDYTGLMEEFAGTPTSMGFSPMYGKFSDSENVFVLIAYVYPGSPADRAGIKRGSIIMKVDGVQLNTTNYQTLLQKDKYTVNLGILMGNSISVSPVTLSLTAEIIDANPIIYHTVLNVGGTLIGYMVYVEFINGSNDILLDKLGEIIDEFKNQGITDLVIDLRYNPGGEITAANYFASCLAPQSNVTNKSVFVRFNYNTIIQNEIISIEGSESEYLVNKFSNTGHHIDLDRLYFLTGQRTASASELLMTGLSPYMQVIKIGEQTYGKYTGAWVISDTNDPPKHNWAIVPIVSKYSNSVGFTDFKDGLTPDYAIEDDLFDAKPFGDESDPLLGKAIELITGQPALAKKSAGPNIPFQQLGSSELTRKSNLLIPRPEFIIEKAAIGMED